MRRLIFSCLFGGCFLVSSGCGSPNQQAQAPVTAKAITWEYTVLINESGDQFPPHLRKLMEEGWEVYLVTGGQAYVSNFRTTNGETTNTVAFSRRDYFLKRQK
jgi:hypothetical protein